MAWVTRMGSARLHPRVAYATSRCKRHLTHGNRSAGAPHPSVFAEDKTQACGVV